MRKIIKLTEGDLRGMVSEALNEYLDNNWMVPLRAYMSMSTYDKAWDTACSSPYSFKTWCENQDDVVEYIDSLVEKGELEDNIWDWDDYEFSETVSELVFKNERWCEEFLEDAKYTNDGYEMPLYLSSDYEGEVHNEWLIHLTNNMYEVSRGGFNVGIEDYNDLAYTPDRGGTKWKYGPGYNFAYLASDAWRAKDYGTDCVLFQASGIKIYHYGDQETQVIFYGPSARNLIPIYRDKQGYYCEWRVESCQNGNVLYQSDKLGDVVDWCINNFAQYQKHLVGRHSQPKRFARYNEMERIRKEKQAELAKQRQVSEDTLRSNPRKLFYPDGRAGDMEYDWDALNCERDTYRTYGVPNEIERMEAGRKIEREWTPEELEAASKWIDIFLDGR